MNIDADNAYKLARRKVKDMSHAVGDEFEILVDQTEIIEDGWLFYYNTKDYIHSGNPTAALAGNGPIFISKNGEVQVLSSAGSRDEVLTLKNKK